MKKSSQITILAVDDDPSCRWLLKECLLSEGFNVIEASDGEEALRIFRDRISDQAAPHDLPLVITDLDMPKLDGRKLIPELRKLAQNVRVLVLSGIDTAGTHHQQLAKTLNADEFLPKPYTPDDLLQVVARLIGKPITSSGITISPHSSQLTNRHEINCMEELRLKHVLRKLIDDRKITLRELSKQTGVPQSSLSSFLAGASSSKPEHILALSKFFGVSMEFLLFGKDERPPSMEETLTTELFSGWLKVKVERAIPGKRKISGDDGNDE